MAQEPPATPGWRTAYGKPLGWTRGWTLVVSVWVVAAALLAAARVDVGHVTALSAREAAAIAAVEAAEVTPDLTTAEALQLVVRTHGGTTTGRAGEASGPQWYAFDRPWEDRVYVYWQLGDYEPLGWAVDDDGTVTPEAETGLMLRDLAERRGAAP